MKILCPKGTVAFRLQIPLNCAETEISAARGSTLPTKEVLFSPSRANIHFSRDIPPIHLQQTALTDHSESTGQTLLSRVGEQTRGYRLKTQGTGGSIGWCTAPFLHHETNTWQMLLTRPASLSTALLGAAVATEARVAVGGRTYSWRQVHRQHLTLSALWAGTPEPAVAHRSASLPAGQS